MRLPVFFRRRSLVVPTLPGGLLLLGLSAAATGMLLFNAAAFLAIDEPVDGEYLVIEGWLGKGELRQAYRVFGAHGYRLAIVSGGPISDEFNTGPDNFAVRARQYLLSIGFPQQKLIAVPAPFSAQERTFLSAVMVRNWFLDNSLAVKSLDIFSADVHARRSRDLYRLAFGDDVEVGVYAAESNDFELNRWWRTSDAARSVGAELIGWLYVKCCFSTGEQGSHFEKWGIAKSPENL